MEWAEGQMAQAESAPEALALLCSDRNQEYINCVTLQHLSPLAFSCHNNVILEQIFTGEFSNPEQIPMFRNVACFS